MAVALCGQLVSRCPIGLVKELCHIKGSALFYWQFDILVPFVFLIAMMLSK